MTLSLHLGWWLLPAAITFVAIVIANLAVPEPNRSGSFLPDWGSALAFLAFNALAIIVSLCAWLIWALA